MSANFGKMAGLENASKKVYFMLCSRTSLLKPAQRGISVMFWHTPRHTSHLFVSHFQYCRGCAVAVFKTLFLCRFVHLKKLEKAVNINDEPGAVIKYLFRNELWHNGEIKSIKLLVPAISMNVYNQWRSFYWEGWLLSMFTKKQGPDYCSLSTCNICGNE